ncbi:MAG: hypothetical protein CBC13_05895 [Planctomycetia bacterium TMED53]|nr:MAG: hypothetical protein CBC13_05895 [Planctomycetia bacterium TMED53]
MAAEQSKKDDHCSMIYYRKAHPVSSNPRNYVWGIHFTLQKSADTSKWNFGLSGINEQCRYKNYSVIEKTDDAGGRLG